MQRDYDLVKQRLGEIKNEIKATGTDEDPQRTMALSTRLSDIQRRQFQFNKTRGLQIIGLELEGPAIAIDKFKKENSFINLMEISTKGVPQPSIYSQ